MLHVLFPLVVITFIYNNYSINNRIIREDSYLLVNNTPQTFTNRILPSSRSAPHLGLKFIKTDML